MLVSVTMGSFERERERYNASRQIFFITSFLFCFIRVLHKTAWDDFSSVNCVPPRDEQASRATIRSPLMFLWDGVGEGGGVWEGRGPGKGAQNEFYTTFETISTGVDG